MQRWQALGEKNMLLQMNAATARRVKEAPNG